MSTPRQILAAIFDMDGLLIDSVRDILPIIKMITIYRETDGHHFF